jgi:O-antigen/teichoic acid export membrane protein
MFVSWAFGGAVLPWFSRDRPAEGLSLARGFELGLKAMIAMLLPVALVFAILAEPLIDLIYGDGFDGAVLPLQLLAAMTVLYGINAYISMLMISRDRPGAFTRPAAIVVGQNVIFNFILIPPFGAAGAAANAVISGILLAVLTLRNATSIAGPISTVRAFAPPVAAGLAFAAVLVLGGSELSLPTLAFAGAIYVGAFLLVERVFFKEDFQLYGELIRRRGSVPSAADLPRPDPLEP